MEKFTLRQVLESFNAPVNEEQAWAICFQCIEFIINNPHPLLTSSSSTLPLSPENKSQVVISLESVKFSFQGNLLSIYEKSTQSFKVTEKMVLRNLGVVIFHALDFGLNKSEEQKLSENMEKMIMKMTSGCDGNKSGTQEGDEGIEDDEEKLEITFKEILEICWNHYSKNPKATLLSRDVCRVLVHESSELLYFLQKISDDHDLLDSNNDVNTIPCLERKDWARSWMQVVAEMRSGVKLKKVPLEEIKRNKSEYALTPYEMLMEDVKGKRYKLHKPTITNDITHVSGKRDVHDLILEFIRSRPPLQPVNKRLLAEVEKERPNKREQPISLSSSLSSLPYSNHNSSISPREQLLSDIRSCPFRLKPTATRYSPIIFSNTFGPSPLTPFNQSPFYSSSTSSSPANVKKLIKPDLQLLSFNNSDDDEDENEEEEEEDEEMKRHSKMIEDDLHLDGVEIGDINNKIITNKVNDMNKELNKNKNKLPVQIRPFTPLSPKSPPLHLPWQHTDKLKVFNFFTKSTKNKPTKQNKTIKKQQTTVEESPRKSMINFDILTTNEALKSLPPSSNCLSLTIDEIIHIRNVLTRADLECLSTHPQLHNLLFNEKICFTCKKVKFSLFGPWPTKCALCRRKVCTQCTSKMRIPTEHFEHIPVYTLNPCSHNLENEPNDIICGSAPLTSDSFMDQVPKRLGKMSNEGKKNQQQKTQTPNQSNLNSLLNENEKQNDNFKPNLFSSQTKLEQFSSKKFLLSRSETIAQPYPSSMSSCSSSSSLSLSSLLQNGPLMNICIDCKTMIVSIIRASRKCLVAMNINNNKEEQINNSFKDSKQQQQMERAYSARPINRNSLLASNKHLCHHH